MSSHPTAFLTPSPLSLRHRSYGQTSTTLTQRRCGPVMLSAVTTGAGIITLSATSAGLFYFLRPKLSSSATKSTTTTSSDPEPTIPPPPPPTSTAVIGLSQPDAEKVEQSGPLLPTPAPITSPVPQLYMDSINPALFDFRDEMSITQNRLSEEFAASASMLSDMDTVESVVVVDGDRDVIWVSGANIAGNISIPNLSKLIKEEGDVHIASSKEGWMFMGEKVKEVGVVKMKQGLIAVGGEAEGFFGELEKRITIAVANKLGRILEVGKSLGRA